MKKVQDLMKNPKTSINASMQLKQKCGDGLRENQGKATEPFESRSFYHWTPDIIAETEIKWRYLNGRFMSLYANGSINPWSKNFTQEEKAQIRLKNEWFPILVKYDKETLGDGIGEIISGRTKFTDRCPNCMQFNDLCKYFHQQKIRKSQNFLSLEDKKEKTPMQRAMALKSLIQCFRRLGKSKKSKELWQRLQALAKENHLSMEEITKTE